MAALFSTPKMPAAPTAAPPAPTVTDPSVVAAQQEAAREQAQAAGRASTLLTSGQGASGQAPIVRKTLLGQ